VGINITPGDYGQGLNHRSVDLGSTEVQTLLDGEESILHDLRKEAKRTRYQMELFSNCYGEEYQQLLEQVKMVQEILGDLQDSFVLRAMAENRLDGDLGQLCPEWDSLFHGHRLRFWSQWQPLQCQLIDPDYRYRCRQLLENPLPRPKSNHENITNPAPTGMATAPAMGT
jgi:CHAD domain-containing protein